MAYVRTAEEIDRIQALVRTARFALEGVSIEFETTKEFARSVLPPCLEPVEARGVITVSRWQAGVCGEFESTAVMLNAKWREYVGTYFLTLIVSGDMPVTIGRELWGEPKKLGDSHLYRDGDDVYAYGERHGVRVVEIDASFDQDLGEQVIDSYALEVNGYLGHDASLAADPFVAAFLNARRFDSVRQGTGELTLTGTPFDPVDEIPIVATGRALHYTGESVYTEAARETLPDRETYLPYILGRSYDDLTQHRVPRRHRDQRAGQ